MPGENWLQPRFPAWLHKPGRAGELSARQRTLSSGEHRSRLIETAVTPHPPQPPPTWPLAVPDVPACSGQRSCRQQAWEGGARWS